MVAYRERVVDRHLEEEIDEKFNLIDKKKDMELHRYYLYDKTREDNSMVPMLYAYTRDKKLSDAFQASRNPDLFVYKHSKEPIEIIADIEHKHPGIRLRKTELKSRSKENPSETITVPIVLTCEEEVKVASVQDDIYNILNVKKCMDNMMVLADGLNYALKELGYFDIYRYLSQMQYMDDDLGYFYDGVGVYRGMEPGPLPNIIPDEFSLFMLMFGNTLRA